MRKLFLIFVFIYSLSTVALSQRFAYVDTKYILDNVPAYKSAQEQLNIVSKEWQSDIEKLYDEVDKLYKDYKIEKVLLSPELKKKREDEIAQKEKEVKNKQKKYFGKDGDLFKKRQELIKPIQDEVFNAIKKLGEEGNFAVIFDVASGMGIMYNDPKYDKSDEVLKKLGYKN